MVAKKTENKKIRAFAVHHRVRFPCKTVVRKTPYLETSDPHLIELLTKCKDDTAQEVPVGSDSKPREDPILERGEGLEPAPDPEPESEDQAVSEPEPNWEFKTIPSMRAWLDRCGVVLPKSARNKGKHEDLCRSAWAEGLRPHPLYGMPGGPEPGPGQGGVKVTEETLTAAVAKAREAGLEIPQATLDALASQGPSEADSGPEGKEVPQGAGEDEEASSDAEGAQE